MQTMKRTPAERDAALGHANGWTVTVHNLDSGKGYEGSTLIASREGDYVEAMYSRASNGVVRGYVQFDNGNVYSLKSRDGQTKRDHLKAILGTGL